jgi:hypothetical protein
VPFKEAAGAATLVSVEFVLDFGTSQPVVGCVKVPDSDSGYQALAAFTQQENLAPPTYAQSGLLCTINNVPDSNGACGQAVSGGYVYWSYWHGSSGSWQYSNTGASGVVAPGDVEGWKFQNPGHGNPTDPPPAAAPAYATVCGPTEPVTTTTATTITPTTSTVPVTTVVPANVNGSASAKATQPTAVTSSGGTASSVAPSTTSTTVVASGSASPGSTPSTSANQTDRKAQALNAVPADLHKENGGSPGPFIIGALILAALVAASVFRLRKRPDSQ